MICTFPELNRQNMPRIVNNNSTCFLCHFFIISICLISGLTCLSWKQKPATGRSRLSDPHPLSGRLAEWHWPMTPPSLHCHILQAVKSMSETRVGWGQWWSEMAERKRGRRGVILSVRGEKTKVSIGSGPGLLCWRGMQEVRLVNHLFSLLFPLCGYCHF